MATDSKAQADMATRGTTSTEGPGFSSPGGLRRERSGSMHRSRETFDLEKLVHNVGDCAVALGQYDHFNLDLCAAYNAWRDDKYTTHMESYAKQQVAQGATGEIDLSPGKDEFEEAYSIGLRSIRLAVQDGRPLIIVSREKFTNSCSKKTAAFARFMQSELGIGAGDIEVVASGSVTLGDGSEVENFNAVRVNMPLEILINTCYGWSHKYAPTAEEVDVAERLQQAFYDDGIGGVAPIDVGLAPYRDDATRARDKFAGTQYERLSVIPLYDRCLADYPDSGNRPLVFAVRRYTHPSTASQKTQAIRNLVEGKYGCALLVSREEGDHNVLVFEGGVTQAKEMLARREVVLKQEAEAKAKQEAEARARQEAEAKRAEEVARLRQQKFLRSQQEAERLQKQHDEMMARAAEGGSGKWTDTVGASRFCKDVCGPML